MILDRARKVVLDRIGAWARAKGIEAPAAAPLAPAPAHAAADLALSWPLAAAKAARLKPLDIAADLATALKDPLFESAVPAPPGFVNLRYSQAALLDGLKALLADPAAFGQPEPKRTGRVLIEYVSANPTGPVHLASGRAAALGDSMVRILRRLGVDAAGEYYVNDAGRQVELLGLSLKARFNEQRGRPSALPEDGYQGDYVKEMAAALPPEADGWTPADFSRHGVGVMLARHQADMERYGARFDRWFRESELHAAKAVDATLVYLKSRGMVHDKDGAVWLGTSKDGSDDKDRVIVRADGRPTYFLADIAYHKDKLDRGWEKLVDVLGADHHGYMGRMKAAVAALGKGPDAFVPVIHQMVILLRGGEKVKMSKRAGEFVTLAELMDEAGVDACRWFFAMHTPNTHMNFDLDLAKKKSQDNPVYYVQYVHARIASIVREAESKGLAAPDSSLPPDDRRAGIPSPSSLSEPESRALLAKLALFQRTLETCADDMTPHHLTTYLSELGGLYHAFYEKHRVVDPVDPETSRARLALCLGVQATIREGLGLLGVSAPEKM